MDFARRVWLFPLQKPEEINSGNVAVDLRVSYVSMDLLCFGDTETSVTSQGVNARTYLRIIWSFG